MKVVKLVQGSKEWHEFRAEKFTASDASAMMGLSKYKSRTQLLAEKCEGVFEEVTPHKQALFDKGHAAEAAARPLVEEIIGDELYPATAVSDDWDLIAASFDGVTMLEDAIFEHKLFNQSLIEYIETNSDLPDTHWPQVEHQLFVSGASVCHFRVSDGTEENSYDFEYVSIPERMKKVIDGWKVFEADMKSYKPAEKQQEVTAVQASFPAITYKVAGTEISTNISSCLQVIKELAEAEMNKKLESDQDFADKDQLNKDVKKARASLKDMIAKVRGEFVSYSQFEEVAQEMDGVLQKMQSHGEKQVKQAKEEKKQAILNEANAGLLEHIKEANGKIAPMGIMAIMGDIRPDWTGAMKNKRTIESLTNAVNEEIAKWKVEINQVIERVAPNLQYLRDNAEEYKFLFSDAQQLVNQDPEPFQAIVKSRIADHKQAEEERLEAERQRIEREAKEKAEREAEAKAEAERERIRQEERAKAQAEEQAKREAEKAAQPEPEQEPEVIGVDMASEPDQAVVAEVEDKRVEIVISCYESQRSEIISLLMDQLPVEVESESRVVMQQFKRRCNSRHL